jgi:hypothetical protein
MKKLAIHMGFDNLCKEMKVSLMEIASREGLSSTTWYPFVLFQKQLDSTSLFF